MDSAGQSAERNLDVCDAADCFPPEAFLGDKPPRYPCHTSHPSAHAQVHVVALTD